MTIGLKAMPVKKKRGRPKEERRVDIHALIRPRTLKAIDKLVDKKDRQMASRGKVIDRRLEP